MALPGSGNQQIFSGADVEFDPINKLFLVAQPVTRVRRAAVARSTYTIEGQRTGTLNGFNFSNAFNVVALHIALNPSNRSGFVDGPDSGVSEIQLFTY